MPHRSQRSVSGTADYQAGIHWPDLNEDIRVENLVLSQPFRRKSGFVSAVAGEVGG
jgi:hypothetical protein